jgi:hypothetical protein
MKELIYKKGLLLKVVSWENDGDYYKTTETYFEDIEEAKAIQKLCSILFKSENNGDNGIGNSFGGLEDRIEEYRQEDDYFKERYNKETFAEFVKDTSHNYMEYSEEGYDYRVCESAKLYKIKEDVYLDMVEL